MIALICQLLGLISALGGLNEVLRVRVLCDQAGLFVRDCSRISLAAAFAHLSDHR